LIGRHFLALLDLAVVSVVGGLRKRSVMGGSEVEGCGWIAEEKVLWVVARLRVVVCGLWEIEL
jgi:hypothetical protein